MRKFVRRWTARVILALLIVVLLIGLGYGLYQIRVPRQDGRIWPFLFNSHMIVGMSEIILWAFVIFGAIAIIIRILEFLWEEAKL